LSRQVADSGLFPAIDIEASVSRAMIAISDEPQLTLARGLKELYSVYRQNRDLISIGDYERGSDPKVDQALLAHEPMRQYLRQPQGQKVTMEESLHDLAQTARLAGVSGAVR
jgi:flagellum-specific ATP synthase